MKIISPLYRLRAFNLASQAKKAKKTKPIPLPLFMENGTPSLLLGRKSAAAAMAARLCSTARLGSPYTEKMRGNVCRM